MLEKIKRNIFISLGIAAVIYLALALYADYESVVKSFARFNWLFLPLLLLLSYLNYTARFVKWDYYLNTVHVKISKKDSYAIFMSGLIMSVTPGKMGELLKAYLVKQITGVPISRTAPIIIVERITDFISLILLALIGAYIFDYGKPIVLGTAFFFLGVTYLISHRKLALSIIEYAGKFKILKKHLSRMHDAYESSYLLLQPRPLFLMIIVSLFSWFFECFGFYIILRNFDIDISVLWASFVYAFATIAGAITMLPGGLGVTDGSLTYLISKEGVGLDLAVASTFIIRVVTLWFAVLVGMVSVLIYQKRFGDIKIEPEKQTK